MNEVYWSDKERNGYTREAIDRKRLSLEGVLVPLTARFNEDLLDMAGFATVDVGWAWGPFRAWLALKR
jgi:tRNA (cmo5U34)-methyltransferase